VAPEYQNMVAKRAKERERVDNCQKQATEKKILPRDRPQFVIHCLDGGAGPSVPSIVAPEYQEFAAKSAKEKERIDNCQRQATEQKVLPRAVPNSSSAVWTSSGIRRQGENPILVPAEARARLSPFAAERP
jgi:hypothetical protein